MTPNVWDELAVDYENARQRADSYDHLLEWPDQQALCAAISETVVISVGPIYDQAERAALFDRLPPVRASVES